MFVTHKSLKISVITIDQKLKFIKVAMKTLVKKIIFLTEVIVVIKIKSAMISIAIGMIITEVATIITEGAEVEAGLQFLLIVI